MSISRFRQQKTEMKETLSSDQNSRVQLVRRLISQTKARRKEALFIAEGPRLIEDSLRSWFPIEFIFVRKNASPRSRQLISSLDPKILLFEVEDRLFDSLSDTESSQGVLAVLRLTDLPAPDKSDFVLVADGIRDPGNLGTIIRTAEAAGAQALLVPPGTVDPWSPKVVRSGMGSHFRLPLYEWNWELISTFLQGFTSYGAAMDGELTCWEADFRAPTALLIGSEAFGLSQQARSVLNRAVRIPMAGQTESLNAAISAAILSFEVLRQRSV